ncbi:MAG: hypothetical protein M0Q90_04290 [Bacteroidales bacterium]|nr:hypothetical protein [Bacteroidales bacterium]
MKKFTLILAALIGLTTLSSCKKKEDEKLPVTTSLELIIRDDIGNIVTDARVELYSSKDDWENITDQIGETQISNDAGVVRFIDLTDIKYYFFVEKHFYNNVNGSISTTSPLTKNINNIHNVILTCTGILKFTNKSSNPYRVYVNGDFILDMDGGTSKSLYYIPKGSYTIRVLQLSGYLFTPTDETYNGQLNCAQTMLLTYPESKGNQVMTFENQQLDTKKSRRNYN